MKNRERVIWAVVLFLAMGTVIYAQSTSGPQVTVPELLNYQGYLADNQGKPLTGTYNVTFIFYSHPTSSDAGYIEWSETRSVSVQQGHFAILLGQVNPINPSVFRDNASLYVGVRIGQGSELLPRYQIASVGYAQHAQTATYFIEPKGMISMFDSSDGTCPLGWNRVVGLDNKFIVGGSAYNPSAGGSLFHTHFINFDSGQSGGGGSGGDGFCADAACTHRTHHHIVTGTSDNGSSLPPYATVIFCKKQ